MIGGAATSVACTTDADCSRAECGPALFDFTTRLTMNVGPVVVPTQDAVALDPLPLDGLNQTAELNAFVFEEAIGGELAADGKTHLPRDLNGDGSITFADKHLLDALCTFEGCARSDGSVDDQRRAAQEMWWRRGGSPPMEGAEGTHVASLSHALARL